MFLYKSLNINILKRRLYFPQNTYVFLEKVVHVFRKTRTCFFKGNSGIILMRLQPVLSLTAIGDQGDSQFHDVFHFLEDDFLYLLGFLFVNVEV